MPSHVMTISGICVLMWLTIFLETVTTAPTFTDADTSPYATDNTSEKVTDSTVTTIAKTVRPTTPPSFTDADTSPYATDNTTENVTHSTATTIWKTVTTTSTFTDADTSPYATDNTIENVTDSTAITTLNNTTENVTDFTATTSLNNTTENVTDFTATTSLNNTTKNVTNFTATTTLITTLSGNYTEWIIIIIITTICTDLFIIIIIIIIISAIVWAIAKLVKHFCCRKSPEPLDGERAPLLNPNYEHEVKSSDDPEQERKDARYKHHKGRISYYELGKLVRYAFEEKEDDKLIVAMKSLMNGNVIRSSVYGSTDKELYRVLCLWKKQCDNQRMTQIETIFEKCTAADMVKSLQRLRDLRRSVSDVPDSFSNDLEQILLRIGTESKDNITKLLKNLNVENAAISVYSSGLQEIVNEASRKLEVWKEGLVPINPVVMLSLALEDLELNESLDEFFSGYASGDKHHKS